ncbi:MAG: type VI secretion system protein IglI family protein [Myxococcota bacterium]
MSIKRLLSQTVSWKSDVDTRVPLQEVLNLKDKDQYLEAAARAGKLYDEDVLELRALGILLYGTYLARGLDVLPELFLAAEAVLTRHWESSLPVKNRERHAETSLRWFLTRLRRDTVERTESPTAEWLTLLSRWPIAGRQQTYDALRLLRRPLIDRFENEELHGQLAGILDWVETLKRNRLGLPVPDPALAEVRAADDARMADAAAFLRDQDEDEEDEADASFFDPAEGDPSFDPDAFFEPIESVDEDEEPVRPSSASLKPGSNPTRPVPTVSALKGSAPKLSGPVTSVPPPSRSPSSALNPLPSFTAPPLLALFERLRTFEALVKARRLVRASVVGDEIRQELETFDPRRYLPELFSTYYALQVEQLMGLQEAQLHPSREMLAMLYRVDVARFLALEVEDEG